MFWEGLGHEPLRVCFRKLLTPSPPVSQFTYENKGWGSRFQKLKSLVYASHTTLSLYSLSLYTLAYTLLRMSLRSHYSLSLTLSYLLFICVSLRLVVGFDRYSSTSASASNLNATYKLDDFFPSTSDSICSSWKAGRVPTIWARRFKSF